MTIPSNTPRVVLARKAKVPCFLALLSLLFTFGAPALVGQQTAPVAPGAFDLSSLRPALDNVKSTVGGLSVSRWKVPGPVRANVEGDIASIQHDLNDTLPGLMASAGTGSSSVLPQFAVFRNLDALYDVLLRVAETANFANASADAASLEAARASLEDGRARLGTWLMQALGAQDAELVRLKTPPPAPAVAPPPAKTVIDDGPAPPKPRKRKSAPATAPQ
jgi:hypothetical protein